MATFEQTVKKEDGRQGFIDLLWKAVNLIEFKSRGKNKEIEMIDRRVSILACPRLENAKVVNYIQIKSKLRLLNCLCNLASKDAYPPNIAEI